MYITLLFCSSNLYCILTLRENVPRSAIRKVQKTEPQIYRVPDIVSLLSYAVPGMQGTYVSGPEMLEVLTRIHFFKCDVTGRGSAMPCYAMS